MNKVLIGLSVGGLMVLLLASALAFSLSLQVLNVNAASFAIPGASVLGAPMTSNDESLIDSSSSEPVRFQTVQVPLHVCNRDKDSNATDSREGF